jgi:hypothetical protein
VVDFIEEVEEQLRSDRYRALGLRLLPWFAAAVIAMVVGWLGVWGYDTWRDRNIAAASVTYDKAMTTLSQGDETGAFSQLAPIAQSGPAGYKTLALMLQGNIRLSAGRAPEAATLYDAAAKAAPNAVLGDLARLKAALALMDSAPYPQLETRFEALIGEKKPFDLEAREALAMAKLAVGKTAEARGDLNALTLTLGVSQAMRGRAGAAIALIDAGEVPAALAAVKAAATMPPPSAATLQQMMGGGDPSSDDSSSPSAQDAPQDAPQGDPRTAPQ